MTAGASSANGELPKVDVDELTLRQVRDIELATGTPMGAWTRAPSQADLLARIYAAGTGRTYEEVLDLVTVGALPELVDMGDEGPADPTV